MNPISGPLRVIPDGEWHTGLALKNMGLGFTVEDQVLNPTRWTP